MDDLEKCFQVLNLKRDASLEDVKQAYRDMVRVWHPDRFGHDERLRAIAQEKLKEINGAYEILQAYFFDPGTGVQESAPSRADEAQASSASPEPEVKQPKRPMLWALLGVVVLVAVLFGALLLFKFKHTESASKQAVATTPKPHVVTTYAMDIHRNQGHVAISTTGSLTGTFTVECWAMTHKPRLVQSLVSSCGPKDCGFDIKFRQGRMFHAGIGDGSRWLEPEANAAYSYTKEAWYHVAYVVTPSNYIAYINGERAAEGRIQPPGNPLLYDDGHQLQFGFDMFSEGLEGRIAEVRIWRTARTEQEIVANRKVELRGDEAGLQGYWRFTQLGGAVAADLSHHGFTGVFKGNASSSTNGPPITAE